MTDIVRRQIFMKCEWKGSLDHEWLLDLPFLAKRRTSGLPIEGGCVEFDNEFISPWIAAGTIEITVVPNQLHRSALRRLDNTHAIDLKAAKIESGSAACSSAHGMNRISGVVPRDNNAFAASLSGRI
jgi:hypothetical protein